MPGSFKSATFKMRLTQITCLGQELKFWAFSLSVLMHQTNTKIT